MSILSRLESAIIYFLFMNFTKYLTNDPFLRIVHLV